jgi:hypothetical protein
MPRQTLKQVLMQRDDLTPQEADKQIEEAREEAMNMIEEGDLMEAYDICETYFGLEPDYLGDLGLI